MWCIFQFTHRSELTTLATKPWYDPNSGFCEEIRPLFCNYEPFKRRQSFDGSLFVSQQVVFSAWVNPSVRRPLWRHHHTGSLGTLAGTARTLLSPQRQVLIGAASCTTPSARNRADPAEDGVAAPLPFSTRHCCGWQRAGPDWDLLREKVSFPRAKTSPERSAAATLLRKQASAQSQPGRPVTQCNTKRRRVNNAVAPSGDWGQR